VVNFDLVFGILKWLGSGVGWFFNSVFGFLFSLTELSPGAVFVLLIMITPLLVGVAEILKNWLKERSEE
jgi:hypothetical protein